MSECFNFSCDPTNIQTVTEEIKNRPQGEGKERRGGKRREDNEDGETPEGEGRQGGKRGGHRGGKGGDKGKHGKKMNLLQLVDNEKSQQLVTCLEACKPAEKPEPECEPT